MHRITETIVYQTKEMRTKSPWEQEKYAFAKTQGLKVTIDASVKQQGQKPNKRIRPVYNRDWSLPSN